MFGERVGGDGDVRVVTEVFGVASTSIVMFSSLTNGILKRVVLMKMHTTGVDGSVEEFIDYNKTNISFASFITRRVVRGQQFEFTYSTLQCEYGRYGQKEK